VSERSGVLYLSPLNLAGAVLVLLGPAPYAWWLAKRSTVLWPLAAIVWWCVIQSALGTLLGVLHLLRPPVVVACESLLLAAALLRHRSLRLAPVKMPPTPWPARLLLLALAGLGVVLLARCLRLPVEEYDSLAYHLPYIVTWLQQGWLAPVSGVVHYPWHYYPGGWEMVSALLMLPVRDDLLATVPSFLVWIAFLLAVAALGSSGRGDAPDQGPARAEGRLFALPVRAVACAGIVATFPVTLDAVTSTRCDLPLAAMFLVAVLAGLTYRQSRNPYDLALFVVSSGMLPAMKASGFLYLGLSWLVLFPWRRLVSLRHWPVVTALVIACFLSSAWYLRNLAVAGNPLGVVKISVFGRALFDGWVTSEQLGRGALVRAFRAGSPSDWQALARAAWTWLGVGFALLAVPAASSVGLLRGSRCRVLLALAAASFLLYVMTPYSASVSPPHRVGSLTGHQMRFALPFLGLLGALGSLGLARWRPAFASVLAPLVAAGLVARAIATPPVPIRVAALLGVCALAGVALAVLPRSRRARLPALALPLACVVPLLLFIGQRRHLARLEVYGPSFSYVSALPPATRIGYLGDDTATSSRAYLLYGEKLDLRVSATPCRDGDVARWRRSLQSQGIGLVAVGPFPGGVPPTAEACLRALDTPRSGFTRVAGDDPERELLLYRLL
jgi:hypothetical protein